MIHFLIKLSIFIILLPKLSFCQFTTANSNYNLEKAVSKHLSYLASDLFEGRGSGSLGSELAAKYIAFYLNKYNLEPLGYNNTFYQYVPLHGTSILPDSKIFISNNHIIDSLQLNKDFVVYHSGGNLVPEKYFDIVFVNYGISLPELNVDDYSDIDVEGKFVLFFEGTPNTPNINGISSLLTSPESKQRMAQAHGAVGSIMVPNINNHISFNWENYKKQFQFDDISLAYTPTPFRSLVINPEIGMELIENFSTVKNAEIKIKLETKLVNNDFTSSNVVGLLPGRNENFKDSYIVVTAHYDHLGIGPTVANDSIYNGALDNAIGVSALLELANRFSKLNKPTERSIIFLFTTGEEKGLLGSQYFIEHSPVNISKIVANVNIDGLAVYSKFDGIVGIGAQYSTLGAILEKTAILNGVNIEKIPEQFNSWESFTRSDQYTFAKYNIPSILIAEGSSENGDNLKQFIYYLDNLYHTPKDDLTQQINYSAVAQHFKIYYDFITILANSKSKQYYIK